jgi:hypothetical protein
LGKIEFGKVGRSLEFITLCRINCGQTSKKNPIHSKIGTAIATVSQTILVNIQLPPTIVTPVRAIDQGWHHQGLYVQGLKAGGDIRERAKTRVKETLDTEE